MIIKRRILTEKIIPVNQEFEDFLKSIGGLKNGFYPDREPITSRGFFSVGDGWLPFIMNLIVELIDNGWNGEIFQVKEKFGSLRFYTNELSQNCHDIIRKYEDISSKTCEECGKDGKPTTGDWINILCDKCRSKK